MSRLFNRQTRARALSLITALVILAQITLPLGALVAAIQPTPQMAQSIAQQAGLSDWAANAVGAITGAGQLVWGQPRTAAAQVSCALQGIALSKWLGDGDSQSLGDITTDDEDGDDFIAFFNSGSSTVDISGWRLYTDVPGTAAPVFTFPASTTLAPNKEVVVIAEWNSAGTADNNSPALPTNWFEANYNTGGEGLFEETSSNVSYAILSNPNTNEYITIHQQGVASAGQSLASGTKLCNLNITNLVPADFDGCEIAYYSILTSAYEQITDCTLAMALDLDGDGIDGSFDIAPNDPCSPTQSPGYTGYVAGNATWRAANCDGDGASNGVEAAFGTDPYDPSSFPAVTGPGGVGTNLLRWYRADAGVTTVTGVTQWADLSGNEANVTQATTANQPVYNTASNLLNFNPSLTFDGAGDYLNNPFAGVAFINGGYTAYYVASNTTPSANKYVLSFGATVSNNGFNSGAPLGTATSKVSGGSTFATQTNQWTAAIANLTRAGFTGGPAQPYYQASNGGTETTSSNVTPNVTVLNFAIGSRANGAGHYWQGNIVEVILYSSKQAAADYNKVESYLALKYGITKAGNYVDTAAATIWDATANSAYSNNIAGIGRDDTQALNQKQSTSVNSGFQPVIGLGTIAATNAANTNTFAADKSFLVWGDNGASTGLTNPLTGTSLKRISRIWRVDETNAVGTVTVRATLGSLISRTLVRSSDATFDSTDEQITLSCVRNLCSATIDFNDGDYFTFAGELPVETRLLGMVRGDDANGTSGLGASVWTSNGDGTFTTCKITTSGFDRDGSGTETFGFDGNSETFFVDVNGDGLVDVVHSTQNNANAIYVYLTNGDGTFATTAIATTGFTGVTSNGFSGLSSSQQSWMADVNGDGKADYIQSGNDRRIHVWLGNGNGTFQTTPTSTLLNDDGSGRNTSGASGGEYFFLKDVNADGFPDLLGSYDNNGGDIIVWLGLGNGSFNPVYRLTSTTDGTSINNGFAGFNSNSGAFLVDVTNDGLPDYIAARSTGIFVWQNLGDGYFATSKTATTGVLTGAITSKQGIDANKSSQVIDVTSDGIPDYVMAKDNDGTSSGIYVYAGNGDGTFQTTPIVTNGTNGLAVFGTGFDGSESTSIEPIYAAGTTVSSACVVGVDTDADGIADTTDIDDDNDGILDTTEGNGAIDTDGDGKFDSRDSDSDNDGILDNIEAQSTADYIAPSGTVAASGLDTAYSVGLTPLNTDGNGPADYLDLDTDNDGIPDNVEAQSTTDYVAPTATDSDLDGIKDVYDASIGCLANIVNGSFEAPYRRSGNGFYREPLAGGWYSSGSNRLEIHVSNYDGTASYSGRQRLEVNSDRYDVVYQDVKTTPGTTINWSFAHRGRKQTDTLTLLIGPPISPVSQGNFSTGNTAWALYSGSYTVPAGQTLTRFAFQAITAKNKNKGNLLDNVVLSSPGCVSNPQLDPIDTDEDGTPDYRDTDSDDDSALDSAESGLTAGADGNGDGIGDGVAASYADPNGNVNTPATDLTHTVPTGDVDFRYSAIDSDGDTIPDQIDLDDDNDGIPDGYEGIGDTDGDLLVDRLDLDADNDGILDLYEIGLSNPAAVDSNGDGTVDVAVGTNGFADALETTPDSGVDSYNGDPDGGDGPTDTDDDTAIYLPDFQDLDNDADGLPDNIEAQTTAGYAVPGTTVDALGRLTAYGTGGLTPVNTDGTDSADFIDTDSDNAQGNDTSETGLTLTGTDSDSDGLDDVVDTNDSAFGPVNANINSPNTTYPNSNLSGDVDYRDPLLPTPNLLIGKSGPATATQGTNFSYTLVVTNTGTAATSGVITVTDTLPAGLSFVSGSGGGFTCAAVGQVVTCTSSSVIAINGTATITLAVNPTTTGAKANTATVIGGGDTSLASSNTVNTTVNAANAAPVITSNGGGATASVNAAENQTAVTTVTATDGNGDTLSYSITGGADSAKFSINSSTGVLTFVAAPDFETPTDVGADNVYDVQVTVSDGNGGTDVQDLAVTLTNVAEGAQGIEYKLVYNSTSGLYEIWMRATATPGTPGTTGTAQVTIKVPHLTGIGSFAPTNFTPQVTDTAWAIGSRTDAPSADSSADYISFGLDFPTNNNAAINWLGGQEILLFTFANGGVCAGAVTLMENSDGFNAPPNNPGQQIDVFGLGSDPANDFLGNYGLGQGDCDRDGDGVVNGNDADDDGDGILDSVEGALTVDSDGDGIPNALDTDSDGDGIPDNIEAQSTAGYVAPSGSDTDGDGIDNAYDADNGGTPLTPVNTDGADTPDYLDTDSDNAQGDDSAEAGLTLTGVDADLDGLDDGVDSNDSAYGPVNAGLTTPATAYPDSDSDAGSGGDVDYRDATVSNVTVPIKFFLGGAYNSTTGMMNDTLRTLPDFPLTSPYGGGETIAGRAILTASVVVDWVLIELRSSTSITTVVATQAALLQRDGDVVGVNGSSALTFTIAVGNYHVAVKHRNHLGVMTANPVAVSATTPLIDLTLPSTLVYGTNSRQLTGAGVALLWAGDAKNNGQVIAAGPNNDRNELLETIFLAAGNSSYAANYIVAGYRATDLNLDGVALAAGPDNDDNLILSTVFLHPDNSADATNFIVEEQLP